MASVFLSHSSLDKPFVRHLAARLAQEGLSVWIDEAELNVGDSLIEKIGEAIYQTDFIIAVISTHSVNSNWVQKELQLAMTREIRGKHVIVLPLLLEPCKLPFYLRDKLYADFTKLDDFDKEFQCLLKPMKLSEPNLKTDIADSSSQSNDILTTTSDGTPANWRVDIGSVIYDKGEDFVGFRLVRSLSQYWRTFLFTSFFIMALAVLTLFYMGNASLAVLIVLLGFSVGFTASCLGLAAGQYKKSFDQDKKLLLFVEETKGFSFPFDSAWFRWYREGKCNKSFFTAFQLETVGILSIIASLCLFFLFLVILI